MTALVVRGDARQLPLPLVVRGAEFSPFGQVDFLPAHALATWPWREYHFDQWTPAPTRAAIVLDPFGGTGTSALVASALGRIGISVDLSHDYGRIAQWRTTDRAQIAKVLEVPKPPVVPDTQTAFDFEDVS